MTIKLPPELERFVRDKLESGEYASASEVVAQALAVLRNVEAARQSADDDLRREIDLGLEDVRAGRVSDWDVEELKDYVREQARARKEPKKKAS